MSTTNSISRREFLRVSVTALVGSAVIACAKPAEPTAAPPEPAAATATPKPAEPTPTPEPEPEAAKEAPQLVDLVASGELAPVDERMPANPLVVEVVERIGDYGGTWQGGFLGAGDMCWPFRTVGYEHLLRWPVDWKGVSLNVAESYEVNDAGTEFTFKLRQGTLWSDGEPYTADDAVWWYENDMSNADLTQVAPKWLSPGGEPVVVSKVDDFTVKFTFGAPHGLFLYQIAQPGGSLLTRIPSHYMEQFHPDFNDEVDALVAAENFDNWMDLYDSKNLSGCNLAAPGKPVLDGWVTTRGVSEGDRFIAERNPYYWKVDPEGNQLPYLDRQLFEIVTDMEVLVMKAINGEIDCMERHIATLANKPVFFDNMEQGDYRLVDEKVAYGNSALIGFNWHPEDPVKKELFRNRDFKAGLSHAINRDEILDVVYQGEGTAWQLSPRAGGALYHEELATMHMEYSVDLANEFLDKTGYTEINSDGIREKPDGTPMAFTLEFTRAEGPEWPDVLELVQGYWREVGVDCTLKEQDRSINEERRSALLWDASIFVQFGGGPDINVFLDPRFYFPSHGNESAQLWATWYTSGGEDGEEPPDQVKRQMELFDTILQTVDQDKQMELFREILDIAVEMFWGIGIMIADTTYAVVKNNFRNFPDGEMYFSWAYPTPGPANTCQFFKEGGGA